MKKSSLFLGLLLWICCTALSQTVTINEATIVCRRFLSEKGIQTPEKALSTILQETIADDNGTAVLYRFSIGDKGFVIVSASKATPPILAYSLDQNFELIPPVKDLFHLYKNEICFAEKSKLPAKPKAAAQWNHFLSSDFVPQNSKNIVTGPLLTTTWNQNKFYNTYCPWDADAGSYYDWRVPNGCVALASAQIMNYHRYPQHGVGAVSYFPQGYPRQTVYFSQHTYHWDAMTDEPTNYANEIAKLAYHFGVAIQMAYTSDGSGAQTDDAKNHFAQTFGYDQSITAYYRGNYLDTVVAQYIKILENELDAHRPIYYSGCTSSFNSCHAYVVDGYDDADRFHVNFGWGGSANGYYAIDNFVAGSENFDYGSEALLNIFPSGAVPATYCQGHQRNTASFGYVADGSPTAKPYQVNPDCSWMVAVPHALDYTFGIDRLDLNPNIDFVTIYNGPTEASGVKVTLTGSNIPSDTYTVSADSVLIKFTSTGAADSNTHLGFLIKYNTSMPARSCTAQTNLTDWNGTITDGTEDGDDYLPQTTCTWNITLNYISGYAFAFPKFNLGYGDFVDVYDNTTNPATLYKRFDIYNPPSGIYNVNFKKMKVNFVADNWDQKDGFKMDYYAIAGIENYSNLEELSIYPNPATDNIFVKFTASDAQKVTCKLMDAAGKILQNSTFTATIGENTHEINVSSFASGFYMVELDTDSGKVIRKIMVQ